MLRMKPIADASRAELYYSKSDGGYYMAGEELHREWGGQSAARLGLSGKPEFEQFKRLIHGLDPHSGKQLTALLVEDRIPAWDITASVPKGVTTVIERGDSRVSDILWKANRMAMADLETLATTRVRKGGVDEDRLTGSFLWYSDEHAETRPVVDKSLPEDHPWRVMPDWDRHIHNVLFNVTFDPVEEQWKAVKFRPIMDLRKYFDRRFDSYLAGMLAEAGYAIETKLKPDPRGGMSYFTWDIKGIPERVLSLNSRRSQEVAETEAAIIAERQAEDASSPGQLSAVARDTLGATSRLAKREDVTLADYRAFWDARLTPEERQAIGDTISRAVAKENPTPEPLAEQAMAYAIAHHFQRNSVIGYHELLITAMERAMGGAMPRELEAEAKRQGVLFQGKEVSTRQVLEQEARIIAFGRSGKASFTPLHPDKTDGLEGLSEEQAAAVKHIWQSTDQVILIRGGAGTGKTTMMTPALDRLGVPVALLAPSADASRKTLRESGFGTANTVAAFLSDPKAQAAVRGGGILYVDEAGLLAINDLERLCDVARLLKARIVLQGDPKQHEAVERSGNMLEVLEGFAGLPVARLSSIKRQRGEYAEVVAAIRDGEIDQADGKLRELGWVVEGEGHDALAAEYAKALDERKANGDRKSVIVIDPTHKDGDKLTEALRQVRKAKGLVLGEERSFVRLIPINLTDAQKGDAKQFTGEETIQFFRSSGRFKAGERVKASELLGELASVKPEHFAAYREDSARFAVGDTIRITSNGWDMTRKHRLDNGRIDVIKGFTPKGDLILGNGWVMGKDFGHLKHGLVSTSHSSQSKTEDIVLVACNRESLPAMSVRQAYVSISRGRDRGMIFTDLKPEELRQALARDDKRRSATELFHKPAATKPLAAARPVSKVRTWMKRTAETYRRLRSKLVAATPIPSRERTATHER